MQRYEFIEHTADIGIIAYGKTPEELFSNAAYAMFEILADLTNVEEQVSSQLNVKSSSISELLVAWLDELLFDFNTKLNLYKRFEILRLTETEISAIAYGEPLDKKKHIVNSEVKSVTYHQLKVEKVNEVWKAQVIFDI
jgi:SHS2 domain-containing protein